MKLVRIALFTSVSLALYLSGCKRISNQIGRTVEYLRAVKVGGLEVYYSYSIVKLELLTSWSSSTPLRVSTYHVR